MRLHICAFRGDFEAVRRAIDWQDSSDESVIGGEVLWGTWNNKKKLSKEHQGKKNKGKQSWYQVLLNPLLTAFASRL